MNRMEHGPKLNGRRPRRTASDTDDHDDDINPERSRKRIRFIGNSQLSIPQNVFLQQGSQGPIFNGPIEGGINHYTTSTMDGLQILYHHSAKGAMHDSDERHPPPLCHPGTREVVVIRIQDWYGYREAPEKPIMWVHAPAGYGKTAIAGTISKMLEEAVGLDFTPLGATFFFWRTSPERNNPSRFIVTIAHQLAISIPELGRHISDAVIKNPLVLKKALEVQLVKLIVEPFKALGDWEQIPNRLVIIDGLDECINSEQESRVERNYAEDQERIQVRVLELIRSLQSYRLPLSFLILSRPEAWIRQHMESRFMDLVEEVDLYTVGDHMNDVEKYVRAELSRIATNVRDSKWPTEEMMGSFVRKTNGHMVYASTVIQHIDDPYHDPRERLGGILGNGAPSNPDLAHSTHFSSLHELYRQILRSCPASNRSLMVEVLEDIILVSRYIYHDFGLPNTLATLDALSGRAHGSGVRAIRCLHAVLRPVSTSYDPPDSFIDIENGLKVPVDGKCLRPNPNIRDPPNPYIKEQSLNPFIHSSFIEFLKDPMLSLEFYVDSKKGSQRLLLNCLKRMSTITSQQIGTEPPCVCEWRVEGLRGASSSRWRVRQEEAHLRLAIQIFGPLSAVAWLNEMDTRSRLDCCVETVNRLLNIDLTTCFTRYFTWRSWGCDPFAFAEKSINLTSLFWLDHLPKEFDSLAQQAILHVLSSIDEAVGRVLDRNRNRVINWTSSYEDGLETYLKTLYHRSANSNRQKSDEVAQALNKLQAILVGIGASPEYFPRYTPPGWSSFIRPILDYIRRDIA